MFSVMEMAQYALNKQVSEFEFINANKAMAAWIERQPGFLRRNLAKQGDGRWLDLVHWQSMQFAQSAANKFTEEMANSPFLSMIDSSTLTMAHYPVIIKG